MATITFKAKVYVDYGADNEHPPESLINPPVLKKSHCDMAAFRTHPKYGAYANSTLFTGILAKIRKETFGSNPLNVNNPPPGVTVDKSGYLAVVTIEV